MSIFKKVFKFFGSILPGGGVVSAILSPSKTPEQVSAGLKSLDPIAQYNLTLARPRIVLMIVTVYLTGILLQWGQTLFGIHEAYRVVIPSDLTEFAKIVVTVIVGTRGIEKIASNIFKKKK